MRRFRQFISWISKPSTTRPGKTDKIPVDPATGRMVDAHDPANHMDYNAALMAGGEGVGFVFTGNDPLFFLDIDDALQTDGQWSALAVELCQRFAGCYVEVSRSGKGLHIIGTGSIEAHGCRNSQHGLELYTSGRFCALTGIGDASFNAQASLEWLVAEYFPPSIVAQDSEWTTGPCTEWSGIEDDQELIQRMLASKSAAGAFSHRASVQDLWTANAEALGRCYPDPRGFDHSQADAALCQHLAFWTGKDCARIDRLFRQSALMRDKWERPDYMQRTVLRAVGLCTSIYGKRDTEQTEGIDGIRTGYQMLTVSQQIEHFAGCVYVRDLHKIWTPDGSLLDNGQFRASYGGYVFSMDTINDKISKSAWEVFTESQAFCFPRATGICFRPECPPGAIIEEENCQLVNTYVPIQTPSVPGDPSPLINHIYKLLPNGNDAEILIAYMAAIIQYPGVKFQWMPLIQGVEGNGKSLLITCIIQAVGRRYSHKPNAADISNKFNKWLLEKMFIGIEELYVADRQEVLDALKPLITNDRVEIQGKGLDQVTGDNRANFLANSNHQDAVRKTHSDRRYCVFFTAQQEPGDLERDGMGGDYFPNLYNWLRSGGFAVVTHWLQNYPIPDALNPATHCHRAPVTSTTEAAIRASMGGIEQEIMEAVDEGRPGFSGGWISSLALDQLINDRKARINPNKRRDLLRNLGYDWHPALDKGRVCNPIIDPAVGMSGKPKLYIKSGHLARNLTSGSDVVRYYVEAQQGANTLAGGAFSKLNA